MMQIKSGPVDGWNRLTARVPAGLDNLPLTLKTIDRRAEFG